MDRAGGDAVGRCQAGLQRHFLLGEGGRAEGPPGQALGTRGRCRGRVVQVDRRSDGATREVPPESRREMASAESSKLEKQRLKPIGDGGGWFTLTWLAAPGRQCGERAGAPRGAGALGP